MLAPPRNAVPPRDGHKIIPSLCGVLRLGRLLRRRLRLRCFDSRLDGLDSGLDLVLETDPVSADDVAVHLAAALTAGLHPDGAQLTPERLHA